MITKKTVKTKPKIKSNKPDKRQIFKKSNFEGLSAYDAIIYRRTTKTLP